MRSARPTTPKIMSGSQMIMTVKMFTNVSMNR